MIKFFTAHPESVGETYWQHFGVAMSFAIALFGAAFAALAHAFLPACFEKTASNKITQLHDRMVCNRKKQNASNGGQFEAKSAESAGQI
jgi:hypothetical protein